MVGVEPVSPSPVALLLSVTRTLPGVPAVQRRDGAAIQIITVHVMAAQIIEKQVQ